MISDLTEVQNQLHHYTALGEKVLSMTMTSSQWDSLVRQFKNTASAGAPKVNIEGRSIFGVPVEIDDKVGSLMWHVERIDRGDHRH